MKTESITQLLESSEVIRTDDVRMMLDSVLTLITRGTDGEPGGEPFIGLGINLLIEWRDALEVTDTGMADEAIANIVSGRIQ